jgi:hypothetical protein
MTEVTCAECGLKVLFAHLHSGEEILLDEFDPDSGQIIKHDCRKVAVDTREPIAD